MATASALWQRVETAIAPCQPVAAAASVDRCHDLSLTLLRSIYMSQFS